MSELIKKVETQNPLYVAMLPVWELMRDTIRGTRSVKIKGEIYLPNPYADPQKYENYKDRAQWFNATGQSKKAYLGMMFSKPPVITLPESMNPFLNNPTRDNKTFSGVLVDIMDEVISVDKVGILIDMPQYEFTEGQEITLKTIEDKNLYPYWSIYKAETIVNWYVKRTGSENKLMLVVLKEISYQMKDTFTREDITTYRVLRLDENGYYIQELWKEGADIAKSTIMPLFNGKPMTDIPFYCITRDGIEYNSTKEPVLYDVANINIGHYRNSADHEDVLTKSAMVSIFGMGFSKDATFNPGGFNITTNSEATVTLLQAQPQSAIKAEMEEKKLQMSALAIQSITGQGRYVASAETSNNNRQAEVSILAMVANSVSRSLEYICQFTDEWIRGVDGLPSSDYSIQILNEYKPDGMPSNIMMAFLENLKANAISKSTFDYNMRQNGIYDPSKTDEELNKEIKENPYVSSESELPSFDENAFENVEDTE